MIEFKQKTSWAQGAAEIISLILNCHLCGASEFRQVVIVATSS